MRLTLPILAPLLASTVLNGSAALADTDKDIRFREKVDVERVVIDARAVDGRGQPILGLAATSFQVKVDGKPVALESATWVTGTPPDELLPGVEGDAAAAAPEGDVVVGGLPRGRLIVMLFQKDFDPSRLTGLLRMQSKAVKFLDTLGPEDRVAVLTFDYHLKLWQDFTGERGRLRQVIQQSLFFGKFPSGQSVDPPSLAENFDFDAAKRASEPESALLLIARALQPLRGVKSLVFFGWGMGRLSGSHVFLAADYGPARQALLDARTTVFTLDVTDADYHTLEVGLEQVAADTGGFYAKTHLFPTLAMARLEGALAGHYLLVFEKPGYKRGPHRVEVKLQGIKGDVLAKSSYVD
jgi:VWFA-related protein